MKLLETCAFVFWESFEAQLNHVSPFSKKNSFSIVSNMPSAKHLVALSFGRRKMNHNLCSNQSYLPHVVTVIIFHTSSFFLHSDTSRWNCLRHVLSYLRTLWNSNEQVSPPSRTHLERRSPQLLKSLELQINLFLLPEATRRHAVRPRVQLRERPPGRGLPRRALCRDAGGTVARVTVGCGAAGR